MNGRKSAIALTLALALGAPYGFLKLQALPPELPKFTDVTAAAGIKFTHNAGRSFEIVSSR